LQKEKTAVALRSTLYKSQEIIEFCKILDAGITDTIFFPDIPLGYDALELSSLALGLTRRVSVATGVIRILEHSPSELSRRLATLQFVSGNRFWLGIGTGRAAAKPGETIERMLSVLAETRRDYVSNFSGLSAPPVYIAALKKGIAKKVLTSSDGLLLNFCSPEYAKSLLDSLRSESSFKDKTFSCYVKIFYSNNDLNARTQLIQEFANYASFPNYRAMFENDGVAQDIVEATKTLKTTVSVPESLLRISLANPSISELSELIRQFRNAGISVPCVYPYFMLEEDSDFKRGVIDSIAQI
jgi:Luciferase-like monooxygenase